MSARNETLCPKCGKGQIVCAYLGLLSGAYHSCHGWRHDCTNPACGFAKRFNAEEKNLGLPGFPAGSSGLPTAAGDNYVEVEKIGPGAEGGCPGHKHK